MLQRAEMLQTCHKNVTKMSSDLLPPISSKSPQIAHFWATFSNQLFDGIGRGALFSAGGVRPVLFLSGHAVEKVLRNAGCQ